MARPGSRTPESFATAALLLVAVTAALLRAIGLRMAFGTFMAGALLARSEYPRELRPQVGTELVNSAEKSIAARKR